MQLLGFPLRAGTVWPEILKRSEILKQNKSARFPPWFPTPGCTIGLEPAFNLAKYWPFHILFQIVEYGQNVQMMNAGNFLKLRILVGASYNLQGSK